MRNAQLADLCRASLTEALNEKRQEFIIAIHLLNQPFGADVASIYASILTKQKQSKDTTS